MFLKKITTHCNGRWSKVIKLGIIYNSDCTWLWISIILDYESPIILDYESSTFIVNGVKWDGFEIKWESDEWKIRVENKMD